jgi:hypothetical protein
MRPTDQPLDPDLADLLDDLQLRVTHLEDLLLPQADDAETMARFSPATGTVTDARRLESGRTGAEGCSETERHTESDVDSWATYQEGVDEADEAPYPPLASPPLPALPLPPITSLGLSRSEGPTFDRAYLEERLAGRVLALVGGVALVLGAVFFLSLAFSRGWIGPSMQVVLGLAGGSIGLAIGGSLLLRGDRIVGHVLSAVGLAIISLSLFAATSLYQLLDPSAGLGAILLVAAVTTAIAIASHSQVVAGFGLTAVLAAPPLLGASTDQITLAYMIVTLAGVTIVSLWQTWRWLPPVAFLISAPQVFAWTAGDPGVELAFGALLGYWSLIALAAGGEAFRRRRPELSLGSAPLLMAVGAFVIVAAFEVMPTSDLRVAFLLVLASLHGVIAAWFALKQGPVDPFGLLAAAYGVAIASMAVPLALGAAMTAVVWSAEAATLAIVAGRRAHGPSLIGAFALLLLGCSRVALLALEPVHAWPPRLELVSGSLDVLVASWVFLALAGAVIMLAVPLRSSRLVVVGLLVAATVPVIHHELSGLASVAACCALALVAISSPRWLAALPERAIAWQLGPALEWLRPTRSLADEAALLPRVAGITAGALAFATTVVVTIDQVMGRDGLPSLPFVDAAGIAALLVAGTFVLGGWLLAAGAGRRRGAIAAALVVAVAALFQLPPVWICVFWAALGALLLMLGRADAGGFISFTRAGLAAIAGALLGALLIAPPDRLVVGFEGVAPHPLLFSEATLALGAVAVALALAGRLHADTHWAGWALAGSGIVGLYLLSVGIVDSFAGEAFGQPRVSMTRVQELATEAHVALSVTWALVGVLLTGAGLILKRAPLRAAGLAVLALATVKVFLFDLASLDIAYRVVTLVVLGVLLMAIAYVWTRLKPASTVSRPGGPADSIDWETAPDVAPAPRLPGQDRDSSSPIR